MGGPKPGGAASAGREQRVGRPREGGVGSAELGLSRYDVIEGPSTVRMPYGSSTFGSMSRRLSQAAFLSTTLICSG